MSKSPRGANAGLNRTGPVLKAHLANRLPPTGTPARALGARGGGPGARPLSEAAACRFGSLVIYLHAPCSLPSCPLCGLPPYVPVPITTRTTRLLELTFSSLPSGSVRFTPLPPLPRSFAHSAFTVAACAAPSSCPRPLVTAGPGATDPAVLACGAPAGVTSPLATAGQGAAGHAALTCDVPAGSSTLPSAAGQPAAGWAALARAGFAEVSSLPAAAGSGAPGQTSLPCSAPVGASSLPVAVAWGAAGQAALACSAPAGGPSPLASDVSEASADSVPVLSCSGMPPCTPVPTITRTARLLSLACASHGALPSGTNSARFTPLPPLPRSAAHSAVIGTAR